MRVMPAILGVTSVMPAILGLGCSSMSNRGITAIYFSVEPIPAQIQIFQKSKIKIASKFVQL